MCIMKAVMYHYVREGSEDLPFFRYLHFEDFKRQLDYFSKNYLLITKEQFTHSVSTGAVIENSLVLTFDDGLKDHIDVTRELVKRGLWGIFYIPTYPLISGEILDVHKIHLLIGALGGQKIFEVLINHIDDAMLSHSHVEDFRNLTYGRQNNDESTQQAKRILNYFISYDARTKILTKMMQELLGNKADLYDNFYVSHNDLKQMNDAGMMIGSHSVSHPVFSKIDPAEQRKEIRDSFAFLDSVIGKPAVKTFCYPYGGFHSFTKTTEDILQEENCLFSFNVEQRNIQSDDILNRPQALPRYDCNQFLYGEASMGLCRVGNDFNKE